MQQPTKKVVIGRAFNDLIYPGINDLTGIGGFFVRLVAVWVVGLEIVLNEGRGARATPLSMLLLAIPFHLLLAFLSFSLEVGIGEEMLGIMVLMLIAGMYRRNQAWTHLIEAKRPLHNTYYLGDSVLRYATLILPRAFHAINDHWTAQRVIHPSVCIVLGVAVALSGDSNIVAMYLIVGGLLIGFKNQKLYELQVDHILNLYDAKLNRMKTPRLLEKHRRNGSGTDISLGITPTLHDILAQLPTLEEEVSDE